MKHLLCAIVGTLLLNISAISTPILDQNQPSSLSYPLAPFNLGGIAQSFQPGYNNVSGAGVFLHGAQPGSDTITISLWNNLPNAAGASMLASGSAFGTAGNWLDVFWSPVGTSAGSTLFLVFTSTADTLALGGDTANPYSGGQLFAGADYGSFPDYDLTFRTYSDSGRNVPDTGSSFLLLTLSVVALYGVHTSGWLRHSNLRQS